jgi:hypothetical protein
MSTTNGMMHRAVNSNAIMGLQSVDDGAIDGQLLHTVTCNDCIMSHIITMAASAGCS